MNALKELELQFNFQYPDLYHRLYTEGMLDSGNPGPNWITEHYPVLRKNPPLLLFANDFELMQAADIESQLSEFSDPDYWMGIKPGLRFVPFATTGAGDWYCFYMNGQQGENIPVVLLWHDADRVEYKAKNLQDFIFRSMAEAVADVEEADYGLLISDESWVSHLQNWLRTHRPYLTEKQATTLETLYATITPQVPLISEAQLQEMLQQEIGFDKLNSRFTYRT